MNVKKAVYQTSDHDSQMSSHVVHLIQVTNIGASEIWPDKSGGPWWEWPYKRGGLWWVWPYKRGGLWWEWPYKRGGL